jgi:non-specific serine/threonine protein kinase
MSASAPTSERPAALRSFGRFRLLKLLGRSMRTMAWRVADPRHGQELMLVLPRAKPADAAAADRWAAAVRAAARLSHPQLAPVLEVGSEESWPYVLHDPHDFTPLAERFGDGSLGNAELVRLLVGAVAGLAFAHDAGVAHHDLQPYLILAGHQGAARVAGLEVAIEEAPPARGGAGGESMVLRAQRSAAERDVLAIGLIAHHALAGTPALDERDTGLVIDRMPPKGTDIVRLPWATPRPVPEVLRAIVNRATDRQERQRYRNARTLGRALEGWLASDENSDAGALALLLERIATVGLLPAAPGGADRAARLALMDRQHTNELAAAAIDDLALAFELLRVVNGAQVRAGQLGGGATVLTVRRAIAMVGLDAVRRAALALRPWPGALAGAAAGELERLVSRTKRAARLAVVLRPAGYDAEVIYLVALLQNLSRLVVQYHFADEAVQIHRLMQSAEPAKPGEPAQPGMSEEAAAFTVLGVDIESIGKAIVERWGFDEATVQMLRRLPAGAPVRAAEGDAEAIRIVASCANEVIDAQQLPPAQQIGALQRVVQRYARVLHLTLRDLQAALQEAATLNTHDALLEPPPSPPREPQGARAVS